MATFPVTSRNGKQVAAGFARAAAEADTELLRALREVAVPVVFIFRARAPMRTGRLRRGIRAVFRGKQVVVRADARDPRSGFDYVGVTRFGHRVRRIEARKGGALGPMVIGGRPIFRRSVRGYHPARDWAAGAVPDVDRVVLAAGTRLGQRIAAKVS